MDHKHQGHRKRLRETLLKTDFEFVHKHQFLEFLMFYSVVKKDTNPMAHTLLDNFHGLGGVLAADEDKLKEVKGVGNHAVFYLRLLKELSRRYKCWIIKGSREEIKVWKDRIINKMKDETQRVFYLVGVTADLKFIGVRELRKDLEFGKIYNELIKTTVYFNTNRVFVITNHLVGNSSPTQKDCDWAVKFKLNLRDLNLDLLDYITVSEDDEPCMMTYYHNRFNDI